MARPALYTIPATVPFVDALAAGVLARGGDDPLDLARHLILLPTRRACRSLREAFLRIGGGTPTLLPRMLPIGDVDEDELVLSAENAGTTGDATATLLGLPPAISGLRRQLMLMKLVQARNKDTSPDQAAWLASELARLLDQVATERLSFDDLHAIDVGDLAEHWQMTLEFLEIVSQGWPGVLAGEGAIDPAERRNRVLEAQAAAWRDHPPDFPVIAAGSTGSIPATADLLAVVAGLPAGAVVLPGLDRDLRDDAWAALGPSHPQFGLKHLLDHLEAARGDVVDWPSPVGAGASEGRLALLRDALLPPPVTGAAPPTPPDAAALDGVTRVDCPDSGTEAQVIALMMRQALETPRRTAALVTPDRVLARRVAAELARWGLDVDDSAGTPLAQTPPGSFLRLTAAMVVDGFAPVPLLAALKHPLAAGGTNPAAFRATVRRLETAALRGVRPAPGLKGLARAIPKNAQEARDLVERLGGMSDEFRKLAGRRRATLAELVAAHTAFAETLAASGEASGPARLWAGEAGEALAAFVAELHEGAGGGIAVSGDAYPALLDTLLAGRVVRPRRPKHPRLHVWGPLEARLQHADVLILGGLNEGTWPPEAEASPWMSRPMMAAFGLPLPERRIGLSAHDFQQAFAAPEVVLTRAERVDGTPAVPSRWLLRLENLVKDSSAEGAFRSDDRWLRLARQLDEPAERLAPAAPRPTPPVGLRPRTLSVTRIETWVRDPYAIYARYVLGLKPLEPIDADPGAADRGRIVHEALERFLKDHMDVLPDDPEAALIAAGEAVFATALATPGVRAFWWPRFVRAARWFAEQERTRRARGDRPLAVETDGSATFPGPAGDFTLTARADRIDRLAAGGLAIVDFKTGLPPTKPQVETGLSPQLPLEAVIAESGGFAGVPAGTVAQLAYVQLTGGRVPGVERALDVDVRTVTDAARARLEKWIAAFDDPATPYVPRRTPLKQREEGDYDHLARVREWSTMDGEDGE